MAVFTPPAPKYPKVQKFGRQPPRGPISGFLNIFKIILTDAHYPKTIVKGLAILGLFAVPMIKREGWYQYDAKKGTPWDRILAEREKAEKK